MQISKKTSRAMAWLLAASFSMTSAAVWAGAGQVIFVSGHARLIRGSMVPLSKGILLEAGDVLVTGPDGRVQMLMGDGDRIALRPNSRFSIDEFRADPAHPVQAGSPRPAGWRSFYSLLSGGFRTLTRTVGSRDQSSYHVRTPVATIGIRGCDYGVYICDGHCGTKPDGKPINSALFVGVTHGEVNVGNQGGEANLIDNQSVIVTDAITPPRLLIGTPEVLFDTKDTKGGFYQEQIGGNLNGGFSARRSPNSQDPFLSDSESFNDPPHVGDPGGPQVQAIQLIQPAPPPPPPQKFRGVAFSTAPLLDYSSFAGSDHRPDGEVVTDESGGLVDFTGPSPGISQLPETARYQIGTAGNTDVDSDSATGLKWGRWTGGTAIVTEQNQSPQDLDLTESSLHWIIGPAGGDPALPISGTYSYTLLGGTQPTDNQGNVGTVNSANFQADFTHQIVSNQVDVTVNGQEWYGSGSGNFGPHGTFKGNYNSVNVYDVGDSVGGGCSDGCSGSGQFAGFFTNHAKGAGVSYTMEQGSSAVSGVSAFGNPQPVVSEGSRTVR